LSTPAVETGGKQAASLRFRSLRLQLIVESMARRQAWCRYAIIARFRVHGAPFSPPAFSSP
jgi:hypothetical protein